MAACRAETRGFDIPYWSESDAGRARNGHSAEAEWHGRQGQRSTASCKDEGRRLGEGSHLGSAVEAASKDCRQWGRAHRRAVGTRRPERLAIVDLAYGSWSFEVVGIIATVKVSGVRQETAKAASISFTAESCDPGGIGYEPGQFITIRVPSEETQWVARSYSMSSSPHLGEDLTITVKRTCDGYVSNWLNDNISLGQKFDIIKPAGSFVPKDLNKDVLLIAAGSGITPVMSIMKSVLHSGAGRVKLLYANKNASDAIFYNDIRALELKYPDRLDVTWWMEDESGLPTEQVFAVDLRRFCRREIYVCGPAAFMDLAERAFRDKLGVPRKRLHIERFISLKSDPFSGDSVEEEELAPVGAEGSAHLKVTLDGQVSRYDWPTNKKLLDFVREKGLDAPFSCQEGTCSACECKIIKGDVEMLRNEVLSVRDISEGLRLACQSVVAKNDREIEVDFDNV